MNAPKIDPRGRQDIVEQIREYARTYAPEWRLDTDNPDAGSALALIFAEMFEETVQRFNRLPDKHFFAFLNTLGGGRMPAVPAEGFARFAMINGVSQGTYIEAGERLIAQGEGGAQALMWKTAADIALTPAQLMEVYLVEPEEDRVTRVFDMESPAPFDVFRHAGANLQKRSLEARHDDVLDVGPADLCVHLIPGEVSPLARSHVKALAAEGGPRWALVTPAGESPLLVTSVDADTVRLRHDGPRLAASAEALAESGRFVRVSGVDVSMVDGMEIRGVRLSSAARGVAPTAAYAGETQLVGYAIKPFGDRFAVYNDFCLVSDEALSKRGAEIELSFRVGFERASIEGAPEPDVNWKLIMRRDDIAPPEESRITLAEVSWEYWNGLGWVRLFVDERYDTVFDASYGEQERNAVIRFTCPRDIAPTLMGGSFGLAIRARARRVNNAFKPRGWYIAPVIEGVSFAYAYPGGMTAAPDATDVRYEGNLKTGRMEPGAPVIAPFQTWPCPRTAMYFTYDMPAVGTPVRFLVISGKMTANPPKTEWEYLAIAAGRKMWKPLVTWDETDGYTKSGLFSFSMPDDAAMDDAFGPDRAVVRAQLLEPLASAPRVLEIISNVTAIEQVEDKPEVIAVVGAHQFSLRLPSGDVQSSEVSVDEFGVLPEEELSTLEAEFVRGPDGLLREAWVRWREAPDLAPQRPGERVYVIDAIEGIIAFGDGQSGRVPPFGSRVRVRYAAGGGARGNLGAGRLSGLTRSIPGVASVTNPLKTYGGIEQETVDEAAERLVARIRHRDRAVTARDVENLTMSLSRGIIKARAFVGITPGGEAEPGSVTLVALERDFRDSRRFERVRREIHEAIADRMPVGMKLFVIEPRHVYLDVRMEAVTANTREARRMEAEIVRQLEAFLDPVAGNFTGCGWGIGQIPNIAQIGNVLKTLEGLRVLSIRLSARVEDAGGGREIDPLREVGELKYALPVSGKHSVILRLDESLSD